MTRIKSDLPITNADYTKEQERILKSNTIQILVKEEQEVSESSETEYDGLSEVKDKDRESGSDDEVSQVAPATEAGNAVSGDGSEASHLEHTDNTIEMTEEEFEELYNNTEIEASDDDQKPTAGESSMTTTGDLGITLEQDDDDLDDIYDSDVSDTEDQAGFKLKVYGTIYHENFSFLDYNLLVETEPPKSTASNCKSLERLIKKLAAANGVYDKELEYKVENQHVISFAAYKNLKGKKEVDDWIASVRDNKGMMDTDKKFPVMEVYVFSETHREDVIKYVYAR